MSVIIGAAGGAAHLPGGVATHNASIPVIALAVASATFGEIFGPAYADHNAKESMRDMPPEVPNGLAPNNEVAGRMAEKIVRLDLPEGYNKVSLGAGVSASADVLASLGLEIDESSPIKIVLQDIDAATYALEDTEKSVHIIIPVGAPLAPGQSRDVAETLQRLNAEGLYMGLQLAGKVNSLNALIYAAQILASHGHDGIRDKLVARRTAAAAKVRAIDEAREAQHAARLKQIMRVVESGLWPEKKTMNFNPGDERLESLGYVRFYVGKNADLYVIPDIEPLQVLMVRSDRTSVFNIMLDLEVEGKGEIQNQISLLGVAFAESRGIPTTVRELPADIPAEVRARCQAMELCRPIEIEIDGETEGMELIYRNNMTGSLYGKYLEDEDPYELNLPKGLSEWADLRDADGNAAFTPTSKTKTDDPISPSLVRETYPEIVSALGALFREFSEFMYERGYVVVDGKFEVFRDSQGRWALGDEMFTSECCRFIRREDFEAGRFVSADKQYFRDIGTKFNWKARWAELLARDPKAKVLAVSDDVTDMDKKIVLDGYGDIRAAMSRK